MEMRQTTTDLYHVLMLVVLVAALLFLLTWTGVMRCSAVPGWCDAYWLAIRGGPPKVLIVYGIEGMGDPDLLRQELASPQHAGVQAAQSRLDLVNLGNIKKYDLVIVEKARQISTAKLKMFMEYVNSGGRLVWTGDAGTQLAPGDTLLLSNEDPDLNTDKAMPINPWRRKDFDRVIGFDTFLSVGYVTTFCQIKPCSTRTPWQGLLRADPARDHPLVYGLREGLVLRGDFAIVKPLDDVPSTRVLSLDWESSLIAANSSTYSQWYPANYTDTNWDIGVPVSNNANLGNSFPIIQTSGVGERVAYYAVPPEQFVAPDLPEKYYSILENMYYGMIK